VPRTGAAEHDRRARAKGFDVWQARDLALPVDDLETAYRSCREAGCQITA
jgi:hypothetical protein